MICDELWPGGPVFIRGNDTFRLGTDSVLLSYFAKKGHAKRACDLGCGTGIIPILLAWDNPELIIDGVELHDAWAQLARDNAALCRLGDRINIITGDVRRHRDFLTAGAYDLVIVNPPYYAYGSGKSAESKMIAEAREERTCTLNDICAAASYLTRWGGRFALVHKPERLAEIIYALKENSLEPKRLRFVHYKAASAPNLVLVESRRGGNPSLTVEPPLILLDDDGSDTDEIKFIYHRR